MEEGAGRAGGCVGVAQQDSDGVPGVQVGVDERKVERGAEHKPGGYEDPHAELGALLRGGVAGDGGGMTRRGGVRRWRSKRQWTNWARA